MYRYSSFLFLTLFLISCSNNQQSLDGQPARDNPLLPLSINNENGDLDRDYPELNQLNEEISPEFEASKEEQSTSEDTTPAEDKEEIIELNEDKPIGFAVPQEEPEKQEKVEEKPIVTGHFQFPVEEFRVRWNAISIDQGSELEMPALKKTEENLYLVGLGQDLEMQIVSNEDHVQIVRITNRNSGSQAKISMLSAWSQIVYLLEPDATPHEVDELFNEFGVGPNLDLHDVKERTVERNSVQYTVKPSKNGFQLEASYIENQ